jgi:hypothetical protein
LDFTFIEIVRNMKYGRLWKPLEDQETEVTVILRWISRKCVMNVEDKDRIGSGFCLMVDFGISSLEPSSSTAKDCHSEGVL